MSPGGLLVAGSGLAGVKLFSKLIRLAVTLVVAYLLICLGQVYFTSLRQDQGPAQAIVVLGSAEYNGVPSPDLAARLQQALGLWRDHAAPSVVVTGGREAGDVYTEASASAKYLEAHGVPASDIGVDAVGRDSYQALAAAARVLLASHSTDVLTVSDPFHEAHVLGICGAVGLSCHPSPTRTSPIKGTALIWPYVRETLAVAIGHILGYPTESSIERALGIT